jgi:hypothetical protein
MPLLMFTGFWEPVGQVLWWAAIALMAVAVALTVWTGVEYVRESEVSRRTQSTA